jgi:tripartite-type tricarboxylate transporter receptor subunit TctC
MQFCSLKVSTLTLCMTVLGCGAGHAQNYPTKAIRLMDGPVGGASDFFARFVGQGISGPLGQQVIVENSSGVIAGQLVAQSPPDGYTLIFAAGTFWIGPLFQTKAPYDAIKDFTPVSITNKSPNVLVVHPSLPVRSVKDLIALAKAKPGALNGSTGSNGGSGHIAFELLKAMAGINIVRVAYTSGSQEIADLLSGQMQMTFGTAVEMSPHVKSGRLRPLAVSSAQPSPLFPGLPTVAASGVPGYEYGSMTAVFAPAKTPAAVVNRLSQEIARFLRTPEAKEQLLSRGVEAVGSTPEELGNTVKSEIAKVSKLIKDAGIKVE